MRSMLFAIASVTVAAQSAPQNFDKQSALGAQLAGEMRTTTTPVASRLVQDYVDRIGAKIAVAMNAPFDFSFLAIADALPGEIHEPRALPGGYIFVPAALILAARDESEFAGMLAQAMARSLNPAIVRSDGATHLVYLDGPLAPSQALPAIREQHLHADRLAVEAMARAGFDPAGLLRYIDREQRDQSRSVFPDRATRLTALEQSIRDLPPAAYRESGDFLRVQQETRPVPPKPPTLRRRQ